MTQQAASRADQMAAKLGGNAPAKKPQPTTIKGMLTDSRYVDQLSKALPAHITPERMSRVALTAIRQNPELEKCDPISLFGAVIQSAQLGLEVGTPLGHAYLLPFKNKRENRTDIQFIIGYRGMIDLARRSGEILSLQAHAVYENDAFDFAYGLGERLSHIPSSDTMNRGELKAVYAIAKLKGGGHQIEVMFKSDVDQIRSQSKAGQYGPWKTHYEEMAKKTVIRRLFKYLPVSIEIQTAAVLDEKSDSNTDQGFKEFGESVIEGEYQIYNQDTGEVL